ncbi:unnamed protein product [Rhizoctonia solani]|uniref:Uncharacterized protein n=1 Tax=Rhizoctonia solani TaxID=456999 RepID=A0A8H3AY79_9AGAM|nr:unnamed protein product [Rhizoctonia solani]
MQHSFTSSPNRITNKSPKDPRNINLNELSGELVLDAPAPNATSRSVEDSSTGFTNDIRGYAFISPWWSDYLDIAQNAHPYQHRASASMPTFSEEFHGPSLKTSTRPSEDGSGSLSPVIAQLEAGLDNISASSLVSDNFGSHGILTRDSPSESVKRASPTTITMIDLDDEDDPEDTANIRQGLLEGLVLDREVDSNMVPYLMHGYAAWMSLFLFEPARTLPEVRVQAHLWIRYETQQAILLSKIGLALCESTDCDLMDLNNWGKKILGDVTRARESGAEGPEAMKAIKHSHKYISDLKLIDSLASVLHVMELHAPVFRRACPESGNDLVNLPRALTSNVNIQYYVTMDVLQSVLTHRPMYFRYNLDFPSPRVEKLLNSDDGPGFKMMWLYGVPDRLIVVFARMNILLEDFDDHINPEIIQEVDEEVAACAPVSWSGARMSATRALARITAHEVWRLAAYVYLYMGLCGLDSYDAQVVKVQKAFMRVLKGVKPSRHPDSFLVIPMFILGMATNTLDRPILLVRFEGITECSRPGTMGSDIMRMLNIVWTLAAERPIRWSDLRPACREVVGM